MGSIKTKTESYEAGVNAAADTKKTIKSNPFKNPKTKLEEVLRDEFYRGYNDEMGFRNWAEGLQS